MPLLNAVVDLSHHNTVTDFQTVKDSGIIGVIHKATQGASFVDPTYDSRRPRALSIGLLWGAYHFGTGSARANRTLPRPVFRAVLSERDAAGQYRYGPEELLSVDRTILVEQTRDSTSFPILHDVAIHGWRRWTAAASSARRRAMRQRPVQRR